MPGGAAPRRRGDAWERTVRDYFRERGIACDRAYGAGRPDDVGDLDLDLPLVVDCKAVKRSERAVWLDGLRVKAGDGRIPLTIEKRRRHGAGDAFVTLDLRGFCDLVSRIPS